ncbi:MAG: hypothetical protein K0S56_66 [Microvirga sp.]|nr:hypothetical protein [Microvirga sp.]
MKRNTETIGLLERLVDFQTVSRDSNRDLIEFVRSYLTERGVHSELVEAEPGGKANLLATIGPTDVAGVMLSAHTDVVPVDGQQWTTDPFSLVERNGKLFGRGTADMKAFIACCLSFIDSLQGRMLTAPVHLCLSYDEEIGCVGVRSLIDRLASARTKARFCIVGEPTSMRVATGHKGKIAARAVFEGVEGHSANAPRHLNAIYLASDFIGRLRSRQESIAETGIRDTAYDVQYTTLHVGKINAGTALNIVPRLCSLDSRFAISWPMMPTRSLAKSLTILRNICRA